MNDPYKLTLEELINAYHALSYLESDLRVVAASVGLPPELAPADIVNALRGMLAYLSGSKSAAVGRALEFELSIIALRKRQEVAQ